MFITERVVALPQVSEYYLSGDGLGEVDGLFSSIKKVVKKVAPIALPIAGVVAAPFTGGASLAVAAAGTTALQVAARKKAQKKAGKEQEAIMVAQQEAYASMLPVGQSAITTPDLFSNFFSGPSTQSLVPVQDPSTGQVTYMPQPSFLTEYRTPLLIGGALVLGGILIYMIRK